MKTSNDLAFNGMSNGNKGGYSTKYQHTATGIPKARENYGRGPTRAGQTGDQAGPSTAKGGKINGGATVKPMRANYGRGPTKGNTCC